MFKARFPLDSILGENFLVSSVKYCYISPDIVKYYATELSKVFNNYRQISSEFMTNSIELQMLSEDAAS